MMVKIYQKGFFLTMLGIIFSISAMAQGRKVTGKVTDSKDGSGLPGVSIAIKGTTKGVVTDGSGKYSLDIPNDNSALVISYIGYSAQEVAVGTRSTIDVSLIEDATSLSEVVVTGYQEIRKKDIIGAVTVVDVKGVSSMKSSSFTSNLAGRAPGVTISGSGNPGDATNVRIRGLSSFTNNEPLYVIDGIPMQDQYQNALNPDDIETIQVLKDASAASIYGSRASNGVIVITTKRGKAGKARFTYNGSQGFATPVKGYDEIMNTSSEYYQSAIRNKYSNDLAAAPDWVKGAFANKLPKYIHSFADVVDLSTYNSVSNPITETSLNGTNWWKEMTQRGSIMDHSLGASGGTESSTFYIGGSYFKQEGVLKGTVFNRGTLRANSNYKIGKKFRIGESLLFSGNWGTGLGGISGTNNESGIIGQYLRSTPVVPLYDIKGNPGAHLSGTTGNFTNPTTLLEQNKVNNNQYLRLLGAVNAEYDILSNLTFRTMFAGDFGNGFSKAFTYPTPYRPEGNKTGNSFNENWQKSFSWTWNNTLNYKKTIGKNAFNLFAGTEAINKFYRTANVGLANFSTLDPNAFYIDTALGDPSSRSAFSTGNESALFSYFGKVDYTFNDRYLFSATVRQDKSSKFAKDVRTGIFPSASIGWRLSEEGFMKGLTWLSDLKFRAAYGQVGNQNIRDYNSSNIFGGSVGGTFYDIDGNNNIPLAGYSLNSYGNLGTQWESANSVNFGLDGALLNNSIQFVLDVYKRNTENLLYNPENPFTAGAAAAPFINVGAMQNVGYDFSVTYTKAVNRDLKFNTTLNLSQYKNKINKVSGDSPEFFPPSSDNVQGRIPGFIQTNKVGYPFASFRGYTVDGIIKTKEEQAAGLPGSQIGGLKFKDLNGDGLINEAIINGKSDVGIIGNPHPKLTGGLNLGVSYKNFDVNGFLLGVFGNDIYNVTKNYSVFTEFNANVLKDILEREKNDPNWPKMNSLDGASKNSSTFYVEKGSYVRLANLQFGYKLPSTLLKQVGLGSARVYLQGQNLFTITNYSGVDPAISSSNIGSSGGVNDLRIGTDGGHYPANKIVTLGVNLEF